MKVFGLIILAVSLAACAPATSTPDASQAASSTETSASTLAPTAILIPDSFIGHWDATAETCKTTSDMKLVITQSEMTFWESAGQITAVNVNGPGDVTVKAAFSGEGEQWNRDLHLVLNGDTLTIDGTARVRCP
ncbi:hypothetical protein [Asticcacaulis sp.]|uniref:hypothetical protein n=1 Tax=Asticcacaulis sp. TaxID=1872648 RepID=UPI002CF81C94|nr:hypothetical protein [Asticcacaulis sp.]HTM79581.1 hypothetical protein [Asticcacaulis sp.]